MRRGDETGKIVTATGMRIEWSIERAGTLGGGWLVHAHVVRDGTTRWLRSIDENRLTRRGAQRDLSKLIHWMFETFDAPRVSQ